jgi:predicted hydrocarbon binding protein
MRFVRISQLELEEIRGLYESVMSKASHGLFYREGVTLGRQIAMMASEDEEHYLDTAGRLIKGRGWVEEIAFNGDTVIAKGSIEVCQAQEPTCHKLRGMIHSVMERLSTRKLVCVEEKCASVGDPYCEFKMREMEEWK